MADKSLDLGLGAGLPSDRLTDLQLVSAGGQGLLYRARDVLLGRWVAVKLLTGGPTDGTLPPCVEAQARLSWHPHVMTVHDAGISATGHAYLVMEYLSGGTCEQLRRRGPLPVSRAVQLGLQVAEALDASHHQGLVHCDVKPSNILLDSDGNARLGDFGLARDVDRTGTTLDSIQGSLMYVAPETLEGERPGPSADVYALALTVHTLLSGDAPFGEARTLGEAIAARLQADRFEFPELPRGSRLRTLLERATDPDPEQRPELGELVAELRVANAVDPAPRPVVVRPDRARRVWLLAAVTLVVGAVVGYVVRPVDPASASTFCGLYSDARRDHLLAMNATANLIQEPGLTDTDLRALFRDYPQQFSSAYGTLFGAAAAEGKIRSDLDQVQTSDLADLGLADAAFRVQHEDGSGIIDVSTLAVTSDGVPADVVLTARRYTSVIKAGKQRCEAGTVRDQDTQLTEQLEQTVRTVSDSLQNHGDVFFGKPASPRLLDGRRTNLLFTLAPKLWGPVREHPGWLAATMADRDTARLLIDHHFEEVLDVMTRLPVPAGGPDPLATVPWRVDAAAAWSRLDDQQQAEYSTWFPSAVERLGLAGAG